MHGGAARSPMRVLTPPRRIPCVPSSHISRAPLILGNRNLLFPWEDAGTLMPAAQPRSVLPLSSMLIKTLRGSTVQSPQSRLPRLGAYPSWRTNRNTRVPHQGQNYVSPAEAHPGIFLSYFPETAPWSRSLAAACEVVYGFTSKTVAQLQLEPPSRRKLPNEPLYVASLVDIAILVLDLEVGCGGEKVGRGARNQGRGRRRSLWMWTSGQNQNQKPHQTHTDTDRKSVV